MQRGWANLKAALIKLRGCYFNTQTFSLSVNRGSTKKRLRRMILTTKPNGMSLVSLLSVFLPSWLTHKSCYVKELLNNISKSYPNLPQIQPLVNKTFPYQIQKNEKRVFYIFIYFSIIVLYFWDFWLTQINDYEFSIRFMVIFITLSRIQNDKEISSCTRR